MDNNMKRRSWLKKAGLLAGGGMITTPFLLSNKAPSSTAGYNCILKDLRKERNIIHRMIVTGDGHWYDKHITTAHKRLGRWANNIPHVERHHKMIDWLNLEADDLGADFIVFNGDLVTNRPEHLPIVKEQYDKLHAPYYVVHGNHDHSSEENWRSLWGYGRDHSFEFGDYAVIILNSSNEKGSYECADAEFLSSELTKYKNKDGVFIFCHIGQNAKSSHGTGIDCQSITDLMWDAKNLKMVTYSHVHKLDGHYPLLQPVDRDGNGGSIIHTFFSGHFSAWGLPYLGYRVIEIYEDNSVGTYAFDPQNKSVKNFNSL